MRFKKLACIMVLACSNIAYASNPGSINILIVCPSAQGSLIKSNLRIVGNGIEQVDNQAAVNVLFTGAVPANFSGPVSSYESNGATYSSTSGYVACHYKKTNAPDFSVSYQIYNGLGGTVVSQTMSGIVISIPCGLSKVAIS